MMSTAPKIAVIILTYNQRGTTLECLRCLARDESAQFDTIVWDNGSSDGTAAAIRDSFPAVYVHAHGENLGVASGRNAAAALAASELSPTHFLFLDNDITVEPGFVGALLAPFDRLENVGQTQAKLRLANEPDRLNDGGGCDVSFVRGRTRPIGFGEVDRGQYDRERPCIACGGAMMARADVFRELSGFDSAFDPFGPEDLDFSLRLQEAGWQALFVPKAVGFHEVSHTFGADYSAEYARHKTRHWRLFLKRHAPKWKIALFYTVTAPFLVLRVIVRESLKGNPGAVVGLIRGLSDRPANKPSTSQE